MIQEYIIKTSLLSEPFEQLSLNTIFAFADNEQPGLWIKTHANSAAKVNAANFVRVAINTQVRVGVILNAN